MQTALTILPAIVLALAQTASRPPLAGLWDFPAIQPDAAAPAATVPAHAESSASSPVVARLDATGITPAGAAAPSCTWERDLDRAAVAGGCIFTESGYEIPALAVFDRRGGWLKIAVENGATRFGWVEERGAFHSIVDLLAGDHLNHMTPEWNRLVYDAPRADPTNSRTARGTDNDDAGAYRPYRPLGYTFVDGRLWLHVELLDAVCRAAEPVVIDTGWVPAQSPNGNPWAWFSSRGC
jgi:hypothetical protein